MEANAKLLKKKRIAHLGGKMSKSSFDEAKLPPDDFVYNIMKDMDSTSVVSYRQSQEVVSRKKQDVSFNEGERQMNSSTRDSSYNKQTKKVLPQKSFPLMKKCQTSLKYLKKNRCIPKPRAHVGFVPKPQMKPISYTEQNVPQLDHRSSSKLSKPKKMQSKAYSKILQSGSIKSKVPEPKRCEKSEGNIVAQNEVDCHLSSSDDDAAFESFVQNAKSDNDSTDSDSRLIIHRKRSRNKSKQKKKRQRSKSFSGDENRKNVPKVTSIPLSDSSESESNDAFVNINEGLKRKTDSSKGVRKRVCKGAFEAHNSESLSGPSDLDTYNNYSSSDEDFSVQAATLNNDNKVASDVEEDSSNVNLESNSKLSNDGTITEHQLIHNVSSIPANLSNMEREAMNNTETSESNGLLSGCSDITKSLPKYNIPCYVQLKRDPILDKRALAFYSKENSSEDDCIFISEDSDVDEVPTTSQFTSSSAIDSSRGAQNKDEEIPNSNFSNSQSNEDSEIDDCVIMCEMPQVVFKNINESNSESKSVNSESLSFTDKSNLTIQDLSSSNVNIVNESQNTPETVNEISEANNEELLNPNKSDPASLCQENGLDNTEEFNIQIVAVESLVQLSPKTFETNAVEVIDLSDDDLMENENSEVVRELGIKHNSNISIQNEKTIQPNLTEIKSPEHNRTGDQRENSTVKEQNLPDPKILEILQTIDFDSIKKVIEETKSVGTECETETSNPVLPTLSVPTIISKNRIENIISTNIEAVGERGSCINIKLPDNTSPCITSVKNTMESSSIANLSNFHTINLSMDKGKTTLITDTNTKSASNIPYAKENSSSEISFKSKTFEKANAENRTVRNSDQENETALDLKQASKNSLHNYTNTGAVYDTDISKSSRTTEVPKNSVAKTKEQPNSQNAIETVPCQANIIKKVNTIVRDTKALKHEDMSVVKYEKVNINDSIKCEFPESPSDGLDVIASTFIQDLNPPNKKALSLVNLYKAEYAKYMQIKNTEVNVSAGLKLLHDNQVKKLLHLRSSIKNLAKHDPCFYKVAQENCIIKRENKVQVKKSEVLPVVKKSASPACSSREEGTTHCDMGTKQPLKIESVGTSKEKLLRLMMNIKCAQCGKPATARCQGCAEVYYCSPRCGEIAWKQSHSAVCKRS